MTDQQSAIVGEHFVMHGVLNLAEAQALSERFLGERGKDLVVDASGVEHLGSSCAQVLVSAFKTWKADGHAIGVRDASDGFRESVRLLGLTYLLNSEA